LQHSDWGQNELILSHCGLYESADRDGIKITLAPTRISALGKSALPRRVGIIFFGPSPISAWDANIYINVFIYYINKSIFYISLYKTAFYERSI
jgi:hypothetical protein